MLDNVTSYKSFNRDIYHGLMQCSIEATHTHTHTHTHMYIYTRILNSLVGNIYDKCAHFTVLKQVLFKK